MSSNPEIKPLGDQGLIMAFSEKIEKETFSHINHFFKYLTDTDTDWISDIVPAYTTLTVFYQPYKNHKRVMDCLTAAGLLTELYEDFLKQSHNEDEMEQDTVEIPVCYEGEAFAPDLAIVAEHNGLTPAEVIKKHTEASYLVYMLGFSPGFAYMGGLPDELHTPRKSTPRKKIMKGSVGIAGGQTGVYPQSSPGGWQIIGRTPVQLFDPANSENPAKFRPGQLVRFKAVSPEAFAEMEEDHHGTEN